MTTAHQQVSRKLVKRLNLQLNEDEFTVGQESPNLRVPGGNYRTPDVCVIPTPLIRQRLQEPSTALEVFEEPMPLVVEVWSPSTGGYDVAQKLREYQQRGDLEIWRLHPYERTLSTWVRQADGSYTETLHTGGTVQPGFLPNVSIQLASLFD